MIESKFVNNNKPDYIIPFAITKENCIENYKKYINNTKFVPSYMKKEVNIENFRAIYMPYVIYNLEFKGKVETTGSEYAYSEYPYEVFND